MSTAQTHNRDLDVGRGDLIFAYQGYGLSSKQTINVEVYEAKAESGIMFLLLDPTDEHGKKRLEIPAHAEFVVNTLRNVVLGVGKVRICLVEHFLAATALWGKTDLAVYVDGPELPLGDGSARIWLDMFDKSKSPRRSVESTIVLPKPIVVKKGNKQIIALPAEKFSLTYIMDWSHPAIGKRWQSWTNANPISDIGYARTFGSQMEHEALGLTDQDHAVTLTADGFNKPLLFEDEPVRHKLLDLLGDLVLGGVNPLSFKAQFISMMAGHELDVAMAAELGKLLSGQINS